MQLRRLLATLLTGGLLAAGIPAAASASAGPASDPRPPLADCSAAPYAGDARLGPEYLPVTGAVGHEVLGWRRLGGLSRRTFLDTYWNPDGGWRYPPDSGYALDRSGHPIESVRTLPAGQRVDRFGSEYGGFLSPAGTPYAQRALPPQNLDGTPAAGCNYHVYSVLKPLPVDSGPIAPGFGQPGGGVQYQLDGSLLPGTPATANVMWLIANGYLGRVGGGSPPGLARSWR